MSSDPGHWLRLLGEHQQEEQEEESQAQSVYRSEIAIHSNVKLHRPLPHVPWLRLLFRAKRKSSLAAGELQRWHVIASNVLYMNTMGDSTLVDGTHLHCLLRVMLCITLHRKPLIFFF